MARYGKEHKQATRQRIIESAGRRLKRDGIDGSGIATLMADAGLTNGAFYAHFYSKEDLVASAVAEQLREQRASFSAQPSGRAGLEQIVRGYLSVQHRDNTEDGCPSAALLDEIARSTNATKRAYTDGLLAVIDDIAERLGSRDPKSARVRTLSVFALAVGTLQVSRALADRQLADEILEQGVENALALLGRRASRRTRPRRPIRQRISDKASRQSSS
jgi:TetR/AcrR family transcriptional repressor of nem operon